MKKIKIDVILQKPCLQRYTEDWFELFKKNTNFRTCGKKFLNEKDKIVDRSKPYNYFANLESNVEYELHQLKYLFLKDKIDALLINDLDFPGGAISFIPALKLKFPSLIISGIYHGGSWNNGDIFQKFNSEFIMGKQFQEISSFYLCDKIFVATEYHKEKIVNYFNFFDIKNKIFVLNGLPIELKRYEKYYKKEKTKKILVVGRKEQIQSLKIQNVDYHTNLINKNDYLEKMSDYSIVIFPKMEETFGYGPIEAAAVGCIPLVPDKFSFKETINHLFRYDNQTQLTKLIEFLENKKFSFEEIVKIKTEDILNKIYKEIIACF